MPTTGGSPPRPTDVIGSVIVAGIWPNEATLAGVEAEGAWLAQFAVEEDARADSVESARRVLLATVRSTHADRMHDRIVVATRNHAKLPQNALARAHGLEQAAAVGHHLQAKLVELVDRERAVIEAYCRAGFYQAAHMQLYSAARTAALEKGNEAVAEVQRITAHVETRTLPLSPTTAHGDTGGERPEQSADSRSGDPAIKQVDHRTKGTGVDPTTSSTRDTPADAAPSTSLGSDATKNSDLGEANKEGREPATSADRSSEDLTSTASHDTSRGGPSRASGRPGGSAGGGPGMGSLGSGLGGSGGGSGMPGSDLAGGLGHGLGSGSGMSGFDPSHLASAHDGGSASAGFTSLSSGAGGSGGSVPPAVRPPVIPAAPASAAPAPTSPAPTTAPAPAPAPAAGAMPGAAGGFGRASAAAGGFMATPAAMSGPANVGAAPAASPGLAQGAPAGLASAGAAGAGPAAQPLGLTPAAMNGETPEGRIDEFGLAAVEAVKRLAPAVARYPGLLLAAASVTDRDGPPFIVITTNEGAGWLPPGFVLPRTMFHAQSELGSIEFSNRWYGWADPARILVDYAKVAGLQVRGLASMGAISEDTNTAWGPEGVHRITGGPKAVPCVAADQGAQPLSDDGRGRFVHRLGVALPEFYRNLRAFWADRQAVVSVQAALEAWSQILLLDCATPLRRAGGAWSLIESRGGLGRGGLTTDEWASLRSEYESGSVMCGALRPGFRSDSSPGTGYDSAYGQQFRELRAMEALLWFEDGGEGDPADVVYTAAVVGASLDDVRTR